MNRIVKCLSNFRFRISRTALSCAVLAGILALLASQAPLINPLNTLILFAGLFLIILMEQRLSRKNLHQETATISGFPPHLCILFFILIYFSTGSAANNWFFFTEWGGQHSGWGEAWLLRSLLFTFAGTLFFHFSPNIVRPRTFLVLALLACALCLAALIRETALNPLYRVDHPSFYYRYISFRETFPRPSYYDPHWNGGKPVPYLVASGVWALALLWYPLLKTVPLEILYTPMLATTFIFLVPASGLLAVRLLGGSHRAGWITFILFLVPGQRFFIHVLHYGTTPSIFCLCLFPLILALFWRLLHAETLRQHLTRTLALTAVSAIALCWPGSLLPGIPLIISLLSLFKLWTPRRLLWMFIAGGLLVLLLHPLALVPLRYSEISSFAQSYGEAKPLDEILKDGSVYLANLLQGMHPFVVVFGAIAIFIDPNRLRGRMISVFIGVCWLLSGWGEEFSPLMQWERLMIPAAMTGALAAGLALDAFLSCEERERRTGKPHVFRACSTVGTAWLVSILILGIYQGYKIYINKGQTDYRIRPERVELLVDWLKREVPEDGRVLIAGKAVHGYGGGKVAALPLLIGREMMACDYYGFSPKLVEYQYPPRIVLNGGPNAVFHFCSLYNVTHVMTYHQSWKDAFDRHPEYYTLGYEEGRIRIYELKRPSRMFFEGEGEISADFRGIRIRLDQDQDNLVIKYNWSSDLKVDPPAELYPVQMPFDIQLIGIRPNGLKELTLEHRP